MKIQWLKIFLAASTCIASSALATDTEDSSKLSPEYAERIAVLRTMLSELEHSDPSETESSPHAERLQDPVAIKEAIRQLKEGKDVCTRCLMVCGGAS